MKQLGVGWYRRRVQDLPATVAFYRDVIGLPVVEQSPERVAFWAGEKTLLEILAGGPPPPGYTDRDQAPCAFHLRAYPVESVLERTNKAGAAIVNDFQRDVNHLVYILDPAGGVVGLNQRYPGSPRPEDNEAIRRRAETDWRRPSDPKYGSGLLPEDAGPLAYVMTRGTDIQGLADFYKDTFELAESSRSDTNCLLVLNDVSLTEIAGGCPPQPLPSSPADVMDYFVLRVESLADALKDLQNRGVRLLGEVREDSRGKESYLLDPENHLVGIREEK